MHERRVTFRCIASWLVSSLIGLAVTWLVLRAIHIQGPVELERRGTPSSWLDKRIEPKPNVEPIKQAESIELAETPLAQVTELRSELELVKDAVTAARQQVAEFQKREQNVRAQARQLPPPKIQINSESLRDNSETPVSRKIAEDLTESRRAELEREAAWLERETLVRRWTIDGIEVIAEFVDFRANKVIVRDFHDRQTAISPQRISASDRAWYRSVLRPVDDPIRKEELRRYRAARDRAKSASRRANQRHAMRELDSILRNQRRVFQRRAGDP